MYNGGAGQAYSRDARNRDPAAAPAAAAASGAPAASTSSELSESDNEAAGFNRSSADYDGRGSGDVKIKTRVLVLGCLPRDVHCSVIVMAHGTLMFKIHFIFSFIRVKHSCEKTQLIHGYNNT